MLTDGENAHRLDQSLHDLCFTFLETQDLDVTTGKVMGPGAFCNDFLRKSIRNHKELTYFD